jgi:hypothetical protein
VGGTGPASTLTYRDYHFEFRQLTDAEVQHAVTLRGLSDVIKR